MSLIAALARHRSLPALAPLFRVARRPGARFRCGLDLWTSVHQRRPGARAIYCFSRMGFALLKYGMGIVRS